MASLAALDGVRGLAVALGAAGLPKKLPRVDCFMVRCNQGLWRYAECAGAALTQSGLPAHNGSTSLLQILKVAISSSQARCQVLWVAKTLGCPITYNRKFETQSKLRSGYSGQCNKVRQVDSKPATAADLCIGACIKHSLISRTHRECPFSHRFAPEEVRRQDML